jgi:hypothetical protein
MYKGEVNVAQEDLNSFLSVAEDLKVKGLTQNATAEKSNHVAAQLTRYLFYETLFWLKILKTFLYKIST